MRRQRVCEGIGAAIMVVSMFSPSPVRAQAWVPDPGDRTFSVSVQYLRVRKHLFTPDLTGVVDPTTGYQQGPGHQGYFGDVVTFTNSLSAEYVPAKNLATTGEVTLVDSRYSGLSPESPFDDGNFHFDLRDVALGARYMIRSHALVVTPSVDMRLPLTDYNVLGHIATGTGLASASFGLNVGRSLDPFAPMAYVFANYARIVVEDADGFSLDQNSWTAGVGAFLTHALSAQAHYQYQDTVDGLDWWLADPQHLQHRNVAGKALYRRLVVSAGLSLTYHMGLALSWEQTLSGANVHASQSVTVGASWSYARRRAR